MAKKKSQIYRAIDGIQAEIAVLQMAVDRLRAQQAAAPKRKVKAKPEVAPSILPGVKGE